MAPEDIRALSDTDLQGQFAYYTGRGLNKAVAIRLAHELKARRIPYIWPKLFKVDKLSYSCLHRRA